MNNQTQLNNLKSWQSPQITTLSVSRETAQNGDEDPKYPPEPS